MVEQIYAPVVVFCYKRKDHLEQCLRSLSECDLASETLVIAYSDGYRGDKDRDQVESVRQFLKTTDIGKRFARFEIIERDHNLGLAKSVITGVTEVINKYNKVIVVEDDLLVSKDFLRFMNGALDYYEDKKQYGSISASTYDLSGLKEYDKDIYIIRKGDCWGWATWKDRWQLADWELKSFDDYLKDKKRRKEFSGLEVGLEEQLINQHKGTLDAWAARWLFSMYNNNLLTVYPKICRAINVGMDGTGENCIDYDVANKNLYTGDRECVFEELTIDKRFEKEIGQLGKSSFVMRAYYTIRRLLGTAYAKFGGRTQ